MFDEHAGDAGSPRASIFPQTATDFKDPATAENWIRPWDRGLLTNRPIFTPDDLTGFKIRMYESEIPIKSWQALGANIQVVPWPDVYTALATGVVDGLTGTVVDNYEMKHFENAPYWTDVHEYFQVYMPFMSKITYDSLTPTSSARRSTRPPTRSAPIFKAADGQPPTPRPRPRRRTASA